MICELAKESIEEAVELERDNAIVEHGPFHSQHEAWAVLKEEIEEMCQSINRGIFQSMLYTLWIDIKADKPVNEDKLREVREAAFAAACEAVQVMAMVEKWRFSNDEHSKDEESGFGSDEVTSDDKNGGSQSF